MYDYQARLVRCIDGDTHLFDVDLGLRVHTSAVGRLNGCNAPEHGRAAGIASLRWVVAWFTSKAPDGVVQIHTDKDKTEKYGRWLVTVTAPDGSDLTTDMIAAGKALPWDGHGPRPV